MGACREPSLSAVAKEHEFPGASADPDSTVRVRSEATAWKPLRRELLLNLKVTNPQEIPCATAKALGPDISVGVLDQPEYQPKGLAIGLG